MIEDERETELMETIDDMQKCLRDLRLGISANVMDKPDVIRSAITMIDAHLDQADSVLDPHYWDGE